MRTCKKTVRTFAALSVACALLISFSACATASKKGLSDQKQADAHYKFGYAYLTDNRLKEAYVEFQTVLDLDPRNKHALNAVGLILSSPEFKEYKEAIKYFKKAITIDPNYSQAMNNLGVAYVSMEKWEEGIKYFRKALKNPVYTDPEGAYTNIAYAQYKKGDYAGSVITLKNTISRYPKYPRSFYVLGLVYMKLGKVQDAINEFKKALKIAPGYADVHWELANAYLRQGENEKALEHFRKIADSDLDDERAQKASEYIELLKD